MSRYLLTAQKLMRRLLLQQCHLLPPKIAPFHVDWEITDTFTQQSYKQFYLLLKKRYQSQERKFMIFSYSLSSLQALGKLKTDHPLPIHIQELLHKLMQTKRKLFLPGFLDMSVFEEMRLLLELRKKLLTPPKQTNKQTTTTTTTTKKIPTAGLMPFSDLKPLGLFAKYVYQIWQKECDETALVSNKFH